MGSNFDLDGLFRDLVANRKNDNDVTIPDMMSLSIFLMSLFSLVKFSYWSKFHFKIITGSRIMTIFFYKRLTRNSEIRNTPVWVWLNIWRLGPVMDTKFCKNISNEMLLNAAKCQGYSFYGFWVIKGKPKGVGGKIKTPPQME